MCKGTSKGCEMVEMSVDFDDIVQNATSDAEMRININFKLNTTTKFLPVFCQILASIPK